MKHKNKMKIKNETAAQFKIIDAVNNASWLFMALSSTILALCALWGIGFGTMSKLI